MAYSLAPTFLVGAFFCRNAYSAAPARRGSPTLAFVDCLFFDLANEERRWRSSIACRPGFRFAWREPCPVKIRAAPIAANRFYSPRTALRLGAQRMALFVMNFVRTDYRRLLTLVRRHIVVE
jgi:hypothetical protein